MRIILCHLVVGANLPSFVLFCLPLTPPAPPPHNQTVVCFCCTVAISKAWSEHTSSRGFIISCWLLNVWRRKRILFFIHKNILPHHLSFSSLPEQSIKLDNPWERTFSPAQTAVVQEKNVSPHPWHSNGFYSALCIAPSPIFAFVG